MIIRWSVRIRPQLMTTASHTWLQRLSPSLFRKNLFAWILSFYLGFDELVRHSLAKFGQNYFCSRKIQKNFRYEILLRLIILLSFNLIAFTFLFPLKILIASRILLQQKKKKLFRKFLLSNRSKKNPNEGLFIKAWRKRRKWKFSSNSDLLFRLCEKIR